ncbi:MAG: PAS domain S-box protein [Candidatus Omnitrophica bacterium]|nr:PAS domain S-box protein [Candidatus Omnitrophota bacterium]
MADTDNKDSGPLNEYLVDGKYSIKDLVDIKGLRPIFEMLSELTGVAIGLNSYPDEEILVATAWSDICTKFHRANPESAKACLKSNLALSGKLKKAGDINIEYCDNGLVDGGTPIIVKDKHIATLFAGQVFFHKPDIEKFKEQARVFGYDTERYLEAVNKVSVITSERFKSVLSLLGRIASLIAELGYNNLEVKNRNLGLRDDVLYREKAEARIIHLNSILRAISSVSQLMIKEKDRSALLAKTCRILVDSRNYRLAWIGLIENGTFEIKPAACAGFDDGYLESIHVTWDDSPNGQGPTGITVKTRKPSIANDIATDPSFANWRGEAIRRGYRAMVSVPVVMEERIYGVINVYSDHPNAFDEQEVSLLAELAGDLGFALYTAEIESERRESEKALVVSEESYRSIFDSANDAIFIQDIETGRIIDVNQKACQMYLYSENEMLHRSIGDLSLGESPYTQEDMINVINKTSSGEPQLFEWVAKDRAERLFWVEINLKRAVINGKYQILAIVRDITDRKNTEERWEKIHETFLSFGPDPSENINKLTALCGEIMGADCAMYNRLEGETLHSCGQWNVPPGFQEMDMAQGHICYDVIKKGSDDITVISNLQESGYAETDPNVRSYNLHTYVGQAVKVGGEYIGTLCVVYQQDIEPSDEDKEIMGFIAHAISVEEERKSSEEINQMAQFAIERSGSSVFWIGPDARILHVNDMACTSLGYSREELLAMTVSDIDPSYSGDVWPRHWKEIKDRGSFLIETQHRRKDGTTFLVEVSVNYLEFQGNEYNFASARDITERKAQEEELVRRDYQLEILSRTSQHINAILEVPTILRTLIAAAIELVDATAGTAGVVVGDNVVFKEYHKDGKIYSVDYTFKPGEGLCGCITKSLRTYISNDVEHDPSVLPEFKEMLGLHNLISIPILNREGKLLGCLELYNKKDARQFDAQDVFMLQGMAAGAAVALENANMLVQRNKSQEELAWQKMFYENLLNEANIWIEVVDKEGKTLLWNKKAEEITGFKREEIIGNLKKWELEYPDPKQRGRLINFVKKLIPSGKNIKDLETEIATLVNGTKTMSWSSTIICDSYGKIIGSMFLGNDVTERKAIEKERESLNKELTKTNKRLSQLALKDFETGLHNHHYLMEAIEPELYRAKRYVHPLSVVMIDIDYFRSINDLYGHEFGDMVLKQFATQLKKMVRRYDIVVRFGGEEFIILSSGADRTRAIALAHRLMEALSIYNFGDDKHSVKIRMSMAVASYPDDPIENGMDLVHLAEKLLDKAKEAGGNKVFSSIDTKNGKKHVPVESEPTDIQYLKKKISSLTKRGRQSLMESIFAFAKTIEMRDHYTGEHADSTVHYATQIARALKLEQEEIDHVRQAAILHDLGKVGISDKILLKRSKLTKKEFDEIKKHPQIAADIIRPIQFMKDIIPLILYHHEKWNGTGYPMGIKGQSIPVGARIISIADVYQALTSDRPYRKAFSKKEAMKILKENVGIQFDPKIVRIFLNILKGEKDRRRPAVPAGNEHEHERAKGKV